MHEMCKKTRLASLEWPPAKGKSTRKIFACAYLCIATDKYTDEKSGEGGGAIYKMLSSAKVLRHICSIAKRVCNGKMSRFCAVKHQCKIRVAKVEHIFRI